MNKQISTRDISVREWKEKLLYESDDWVILQYIGLTSLIDGLHCEEDQLFSEIECDTENFDDLYKEYIYPIENERMDLDIQLVSIEEEMDRRGLDMLC